MFRVVYLQVINPDRLTQESDLRSLRTQKLLTIRGMILDRSGRSLALSIPVNSVCGDPKELKKHDIINNSKRWTLLADVLSMSFDQFVSRVYSNSNGRFIYLARQINPSVGEYIKKLKLPGIYLKQEFRRYYPSAHVTSHIVGVTNIDGQGIEGIEKSFNKLLSGHCGERMVRMDRFGRVIEDISTIDMKVANNLSLSIDERLQSFMYRELNNAVISNKAKSGSAVLIDVSTGEILAMVNVPTYNPNNLSNVMLSSMRNRAITDIFEPGSTIKPIVIIAALENNIIQENSIINTLPYTLSGYEIKDVVEYPKLTVSEVLQKSSNVGVSKIALSMPFSLLHKAYSSFGIGQSTNLGLIGESSGIFLYKKNCSHIKIATLSYGYGLMVTPLQLARIYATIGSFGIIRPISILRVDHPVTGERIFSSSVVSSVIHMMENVTLPGSSGAKAAVKGYRIAVKTGTTKKVGKHGKYINKYIAYTAGVAPVSCPRFSLVIVINEPCGHQYYGGLVSAPVFSVIMSNVLRTMNIEPDALK